MRVINTSAWPNARLMPLLDFAFADLAYVPPIYVADKVAGGWCGWAGETISRWHAQRYGRQLHVKLWLPNPGQLHESQMVVSCYKRPRRLRPLGLGAQFLFRHISRDEHAICLGAHESFHVFRRGRRPMWPTDRDIDGEEVAAELYALARLQDWRRRN